DACLNAYAVAAPKRSRKAQAGPQMSFQADLRHPVEHFRRERELVAPQRSADSEPALQLEPACDPDREQQRTSEARPQLVMLLRCIAVRAVRRQPPDRGRQTCLS